MCINQVNTTTKFSTLLDLDNKRCVVHQPRLQASVPVILDNKLCVVHQPRLQASVPVGLNTISKNFTKFKSLNTHKQIVTR